MNCVVHGREGIEARLAHWDVGHRGPAKGLDLRLEAIIDILVGFTGSRLRIVAVHHLFDLWLGLLPKAHDQIVLQLLSPSRLDDLISSR